jgi:D-glycero-alpha-D-manno-heptose-7-phosphate kinase
MNIDCGMEIASFADVPAGTGMGSSSAFTVALLHAL